VAAEFSTVLLLVISRAKIGLRKFSGRQIEDHLKGRALKSEE